MHPCKSGYISFRIVSQAQRRTRGEDRRLSVTAKLSMAARMSMSWGLVAICIMAGAAEGFAGFCPAARLSPRKVGSYRPPLSTLRVSSGRRAVGLRMSVDGESALPGIWSIEAEMEDADLKCSLSLNGDRTVTLPPGTDLPHKFPTRAMWKFKDNQLALEFDRDPGLISPFYDLTFLGSVDMESMQVISGCIQMGEIDPEFVGRFTFKQIMKSGDILTGGENDNGASEEPPSGGDAIWDGEVDEEAWFDD